MRISIPFFAMAIVVGSLLSGCGLRGIRSSGYVNTREAGENDSHQSSPAKLFAAGIHHARRGDYIRAEQYLIAAISAGFSKRKALPPMIQVCLASSRIQTAAKYAQEYLRIYPTDWTLRMVLASLYLAAKRYDDAKYELERVVEEHPRASLPRYLLATVLREHFDDWLGARRHSVAYLKLNPEGEHAQEVRSQLKRDTIRKTKEVL